jgi:hypothetical protein
MGILGILGGAGAAILGVLFGNHQQHQAPPPPQPTHITPSQSSNSTNNNTVAQNPNQQQTGTNTNTQNVGGVKVETNFYFAPQAQEAQAQDIPSSNIAINSNPIQSQTNTAHQTAEALSTSDVSHATDETHNIPMQSYIPSSRIQQGMICAGVASVIYLFYELRSMETYLYKTNKLFNWNRDIATKALQTMKRDTIGPVLVSFVQKRYSIDQTLDNFSGPVTIFLDEVVKEERALKRYLRLAHILKAFRINSWLGADNAHIHYAQDCVTRLGVMRTIV